MYFECTRCHRRVTVDQVRCECGRDLIKKPPRQLYYLVYKCSNCGAQDHVVNTQKKPSMQIKCQICGPKIGTRRFDLQGEEEPKGEEEQN